MVDKDEKEICHTEIAKAKGNSYDKKIAMVAVYMEGVPDIGELQVLVYLRLENLYFDQKQSCFNTALVLGM